MLKSEIKALLKELNQNDEIKWNVTTNRKNLVVITNDYCESDFTIKTDEDGIKKAIKNLVSYFYHTY